MAYTKSRKKENGKTPRQFTFIHFSIQSYLHFNRFEFNFHRFRLSAERMMLYTHSSRAPLSRLAFVHSITRSRNKCYWLMIEKRSLISSFIGSSSYGKALIFTAFCLLFFFWRRLFSGFRFYFSFFLPPYYFSIYINLNTASGGIE